MQNEKQNIMGKGSNPLKEQYFYGDSVGAILIGYLIILGASILVGPPVNLSGNLRYSENPEDLHYYEVVYQQIQKLEPLDYPEYSHEKKRETRLFVPMVFKLFPEISKSSLPVYLFIFNYICHFLLYLQFIVLQRKYFPELQPRWLIGACFATTYVFQSLLGDFGPMFDGVAFLLLVAGFNRKTNLAALCFFFLALTVDERSGFPAVGMIFFRSLLLRKWLQPILLSGVLLLLFLCYRLFLSIQFGLSSPFSVSSDVSPANFVTPDKVYLYCHAGLNLFKGLNLAILIAFFFLVRNYANIFRRNPGAHLIISTGAIGLTVFLSFFAAISVADFTRSLAYAFPVAVFSLIVVRHAINREKLFFWMIAGFNFLTPSSGYNAGPTLHLSVDLFSKVTARILDYFMK